MSAKKRGTIWLTLVFSMVFLIRIVYSEEREKFKPRFSLKITGGLAYMSLGDINENLNTESILANRAERFWQVDFSLAEEIKNIHYGYDLEGELRINIISNFEIAVGTGCIHAKKESYSILRGERSLSTYTLREAFEPMVTIIPIKLGIYYKLPLFKRTALLFHIGGGYYFTKSSLYRYQHRESYSFIDYSRVRSWTEHTKKVSGGDFGFHGGIGFEYSLGKNLSVVIEVQGRDVKIKELKGKNIMETSLYGGDREKTYGTLWYYKWESEGEYLTYLPFSDLRPESPPWPHTIRKAIFDLSGFSLKLGIRIKLF
ncbi:MAG: outer membrane beta-barrel protein [Candidatus Aminicenantes bacterium]|nr:outer membrane beta-barrel protein [Candidatus Aminicenantes bacterium]